MSEIQPGGQEIGGNFVDGAKRVIEQARNKLSQTQQEAARRIFSTNAGRVASFVILLSSAGCSNAELVQTEANTNLVPTSTMTVPEKSNSKPLNFAEINHQRRQISGFSFLLDQNGTPISYKTPNGKEVIFDKQEIRNIAEKAQANKESEILTIIEIPSQIAKTNPKPSVEHPVLKELSKDVLTTEELAKKGIKILQSTNTDLHIRKSAFEKGGLFEDYNSGKNELIIALINSTLTTDAAMPNSPDWDIVKAAYLLTGSIFEKKATKVDVAQYRQTQVFKLQKGIDELRIKRTSSQDPDKEGLDSFITGLKIKLLELAKLPDEVLRQQIETQVSHSSKSGFFTTRPGKNGKEISIIGIAVGEGIKDSSKIVITAKPDGTFQFMEGRDTGSKGRSPSAEQSTINPLIFKLNPDASPQKPNSYPYSGIQDISGPGYTLRHEIAHNDLIVGYLLKRENANDFQGPSGADDRFEEFMKNIGKANMSEYDADMKAVEGLKQAWEKWKNSGYTDNSGYPFVFRLPDGSGYILTKNIAGNDNLETVKLKSS